MKKLLSILGAMTLIGTTSTNVIACDGVSLPSPSPSPEQKIDISTVINKLTLGDETYVNTTHKYQNLDSTILSTSELTSLNPELANPTIKYFTDEQGKTDVSNQNQKAGDLYVIITANDSDLNYQGSTKPMKIILKQEPDQAKDLNTIIVDKILGNIYVGQSDKPTVEQIKLTLKANSLNPELDENNIEIYDIEPTSAKIKGNSPEYNKNEVTVQYKSNNFMQLKTTDKISRNINKILIDDSNRTIYAATDNGVYKSNGTDEFTLITGTSGRVHDLIINDNILYAATDNGVYKSNGTDEFTLITVPEPVGKKTNQIWCLAVASGGTIYAGNQHGNVYTSNGTETFREKFKPASSGIIKLNISTDGIVYITTYGAGIYQYSATTDLFSQITGTTNMLRTSFVDTHDNLYTVNKVGTIFKKSKDDKNFTEFKTITNQDIKSLAVAPDDTIYAGNVSGTVYQSNGTDDFTPMSGTSGIISSLNIDKNGTIYAGCANGKIYISEKL